MSVKFDSSAVFHTIRELSRHEKYAGVAQWLEFQFSKLIVVGSSPIARSNRSCEFGTTFLINLLLDTLAISLKSGRVAQLVRARL